MTALLRAASRSFGIWLDDRLLKTVPITGLEIHTSFSQPGSTPQELVFAPGMHYTGNGAFVRMRHNDPFRGNLVFPLFRTEVPARRDKRVDRIFTEKRARVEAQKEATNGGSRKLVREMAPEAAREPRRSKLPSSRLRDSNRQKRKRDVPVLWRHEEMMRVGDLTL